MSEHTRRELWTRWHFIARGLALFGLSGIDRRHDSEPFASYRKRNFEVEANV